MIKQLNELVAGDILDNNYMVVRVTPTSTYMGNLIVKDIATGKRLPALKRCVSDSFNVTN